MMQSKGYGLTGADFRIFNLVFTIIKETQPELSEDEVALKGFNWFIEERNAFAGKSAMELIHSGERRKVLHYLEQVFA